MPDSADAITSSAIKDSTKGVTLTAVDLPAFSALHCSMVLPCAAIHFGPSDAVVNRAEKPGRDRGDDDRQGVQIL